MKGDSLDKSLPLLRSLAVGSSITEAASTPNPTLTHKSLIMTNHTYYSMNYLLNRHKENRHKTLTGLLTTQDKQKNY